MQSILQPRQAGVDRLGDHVAREVGAAVADPFAAPGPATLVAMTRPSRALAREPAAEIRARCAPASSAFGGTGYISAVSMKLMPASSAQSSCACASASLFCSPQVIVPRHTSETSRSVPGNVRTFHRIPIVRSYPAPTWRHATLALCRTASPRWPPSTSLVSAPAPFLPAVLHRLRRRGARLHDADDGRRLADGDADAVGTHGGAGAVGKHRADAAARALRRRARGPRRPPASHPDHAARAVRADRRCSASSRSPARSRPASLLALHVPDRRLLHILPAGAIGEHQRSRGPRRRAARGGAGRGRVQRRARRRPGARRARRRLVRARAARSLASAAASSS